MPRMSVVIIPVALFLLFSGCSPAITPQESKVLETLNEIRRGAEADLEYDKFVQLLQTAKAEIDLLEQDSEPGQCFKRAVEKCYASYEIVRKAREMILTEKDAKKIADLEMTLSFSLSFSSISLEKANKCYE